MSTHNQPPRPPQNRPQQQNRPQIQQPHNTAPGTPATQPVETSEPKAPITLEMETEVAVEEQLSLVDQFKAFMAKNISEMVLGEISPLEVKRSIKLWADNLSDVDKQEQRYDLIEVGRQCMRLTEDVVNELPLLFL